MPILYFLKDMSLLGLFIGVVFKFIVFGLFVLSVLMMYNMFMIGVESNNYSFGILRTIGMKRVAVVSTVLN
jgi:ABC-type antimicrobial peptide transport system permease subunit